MSRTKQLLDQIDVLQRKLIDAKVDLNIKDDRIRTLEKELRVAQFAVRELEIGTHTMRTLALAEDESDFDPRQTGTFGKDVWSKIK